MIKDIKINISDKLIIRDKLNIAKKVNISESDRGPKGFVEVYEVDKDGKKLLVEKQNLVVYAGREWVAQRIFASDNLHLPVSGSKAAEWICWLGVGKGGASPSDSLVPIAPTLFDTDLSTPVIISNDPYELYADWYTSGSEAGWRKKNIGVVDFEADGDNNNKYLVIRIETTLDVGEADNELINEVGLFTAASADPLFNIPLGYTGPLNAYPYNGPFHLFAKVTFSTIPKTPEKRFVFSWKIYV